MSNVIIVPVFIKHPNNKKYNDLSSYMGLHESRIAGRNLTEPTSIRITHSDYINISKTMKNNREFSTIIKFNYRFPDILKRD